MKISINQNDIEISIGFNNYQFDFYSKSQQNKLPLQCGEHTILWKIFSLLYEKGKLYNHNITRSWKEAIIKGCKIANGWPENYL